MRFGIGGSKIEVGRSISQLVHQKIKHESFWQIYEGIPRKTDGQNTEIQKDIQTDRVFCRGASHLKKVSFVKSQLAFV